MSKNILLVEDNEENIQEIKKSLESHGYRVDVAHNGQEGLEHAAKKKPDIIISDINMPVMNGFYFYKGIKLQKATANIPFIVLTARHAMEDTFAAFCVDYFIKKPYNEKLMLNVLAEVMHDLKLAGQEDLLSQSMLKIIKNYRHRNGNMRALVSGNAEGILDEMEEQLLKSNRFDVKKTTSSTDIPKIAKEFKPDLIIMQVYKEGKSAVEVISQVYKYQGITQVIFVLYSTSVLKEVGEETAVDKFLTIDPNESMTLYGVPVKYVGMYNKIGFMDAIKDFM